MLTLRSVLRQFYNYFELFHRLYSNQDCLYFKKECENLDDQENSNSRFETDKNIRFF